MARSDRTELLERVQDLQLRLDEAEETLRAVRSGEVDAVVASGPDGDRVYTLHGADQPYRVMVQNMAEGALTCTPDGLILFANQRLASILGMPLDRVIGASMHDFIAEDDAPLFLVLLSDRAGVQAEVRLKKGGAAVPAQISANALSFDGIECVCVIVTDLSDLKRSQETLRLYSGELVETNKELTRAREELDASRRMLELVLNTMPMGVFWKDKDSRYLGCNRRFLTDSGFSPQDNIAGRVDSEMPWKEQAELFRGDDRQVMEAGEAKIGYEKSTVGKDGVRRWLRTNKIPLTGPAGAIVGVLGTHEDITESKQAEAALRASQERFRKVVENAPEAIFVATRGRFRYLNQPALRLFGAASASELLDQPVMERVHPDSRGDVAEEIRQVEQLGLVSPPWAQKYLRLDGTALDIEGSAAPFLYEGEKGGLVFVRDITERKRAEEELRAKEDLLSESQRIAHVGSWECIVQSGASAMVWTQETYRVFGVSPDTFVPSAETFLRLIHPDDRAAMQAWMSACLAGLEPPDLEFRIRLPDGSIRIINGRGHVVAQEAEDKSIRMIGIAQDITERRHAEETLRSYSAQLAESNEDLKRFTQIVSHDLRTPFVSLKGFSAELRQSIQTLCKPGAALLASLSEPERAAVAEALQARIPEALGFIENSVTRMDHLTSALLRLSWASRRALHLEGLDAAALVRETLDRLADQIRNRSVAVEIGPLPRLTTDRDAFGQVLGSLLDNAIKYLDPNRPGQVEVTAEKTADVVVFHVRDNGRGIAEDDLDKVFQPFRRAGPENVPGEGIGLAFVRTLLHRLGGTIQCHSQLGVGSTFSVMLPMVN